MAHQYAQIAFTPSVRQVQNEQNSRSGYASMDNGEDYNFMLSQEESNFIQQRDSFYMASVSETDWPYVQHRGGPKGFLKIIDAQTLGFSDYSGNRQYISTGNFRTNDKVSLILMDYANRRRLKILGHISQVAADDWNTQVALEDDHYRARVERAFVIKITAFDWNCPQHITSRYSEDQLASLISPLQEEIKSLKEKLNQQSTTVSVDSDTNTLSDSKAEAKNEVRGEVKYEVKGESKDKHKDENISDDKFSLKITGIRQLTKDIRAYQLSNSTGEPLPAITAGAHLQVPVTINDSLSTHLKNKQGNQKTVWRSYSILNAQSDHNSPNAYYEIAVKRIDEGKGGSIALHQQYQLGLSLQCKPPQNFFALNESEKEAHTVLIAAGIGITPIIPMALTLLEKAQPFELHFAARSKSEMIYVDELSELLGNRLHLYPSNTGKKLSIDSLLSTQISRPTNSQMPPTQYYFCGPNEMLNDFVKGAKAAAIADEQIHYEQFAASPNSSAQAVQLTLTKSNKTIAVASDQSLLDALLDEGVEVPHSCKSGRCKSCVVQVSSDAEIAHLDSCLSETERASGKMCLCVSRPQSSGLYIEL